MRKPKIVHVLESGKRINDITGHVVPADNPVYEIIINLAAAAAGKKS